MVIGRGRGLDQVGGPVRAVVVHHEDVGLGELLADATAARLDAGCLVVGGDDHQDAHPGELTVRGRAPGRP